MVELFRFDFFYCLGYIYYVVIYLMCEFLSLYLLFFKMVFDGRIGEIYSSFLV